MSHLHGFPPPVNRHASEHSNPLGRALSALAIVVVAGGVHFPRAAEEDGVLISWKCRQLSKTTCTRYQRPSSFGCCSEKLRICTRYQAKNWKAKIYRTRATLTDGRDKESGYLRLNTMVYLRRRFTCSDVHDLPALKRLYQAVSLSRPRVTVPKFTIRVLATSPHLSLVK